MTNDSVELHQAWMWDCPSCGSENFCRSIRAEVTREEAIEAARLAGMVSYDFEPSDSYGCEWLSHPDDVVCSKCGELFLVEREDSNEG